MAIHVQRDIETLKQLALKESLEVLLNLVNILTKKQQQQHFYDIKVYSGLRTTKGRPL
jgi:hypothetical protein